MPSFSQPSADEVALLTLHLLEAHDTDPSEPLAYARISKNTLRRISLRVRLEHGGFGEKWIVALADFGWSIFPLRDEFGLVRSQAVVETWPRLAASRIRNTLNALRRGDARPLDVLRDHFWAPPEPEDEA